MEVLFPVVEKSKILKIGLESSFCHTELQDANARPWLSDFGKEGKRSYLQEQDINTDEVYEDRIHGIVTA